MIYSFLAKSKSYKRLIAIVTLACLISSCGLIIKKSPVDKYNREFLAKHENTIKKQRDKHRLIAAQNNIYYDAEMNRMKSIEVEKNKREALNKKFLQNYVNVLNERQKPDEYIYTKNNHGPFIVKQNKKLNYNKYKFLDPAKIQEKSFNHINYTTLQINFDYWQLILEENQERRRETLQLIKEQTQNKPKEPEKPTGTIENLKERFRNIFNKKE